MRNKTRILVTNNLSILPFTDSILLFKDGQIIESGTYLHLLSTSNYFANLIQQYSQNESNNSQESVQEKLANKSEETSNFNFKINKLIEKEETQTGRVKWSVYLRYLQAITMFWGLLFSVSYIFSQVFSAGSSVWLSVWSREAENDNSQTYFYLAIYGII